MAKIAIISGSAVLLLAGIVLAAVVIRRRRRRIYSRREMKFARKLRTKLFTSKLAKLPSTLNRTFHVLARQNLDSVQAKFKTGMDFEAEVIKVMSRFQNQLERHRKRLVRFSFESQVHVEQGSRADFILHYLDVKNRPFDLIVECKYSSVKNMNYLNEQIIDKAFEQLVRYQKACSRNANLLLILVNFKLDDDVPYLIKKDKILIINFHAFEAFLNMIFKEMKNSLSRRSSRSVKNHWINNPSIMEERSISSRT